MAKKKAAATKKAESFFGGDIAKVLGNQYSSLAEDGIIAGDFDGWIDTGSYAFNALISGSLYGGIARGKVIGLAGESATGKTFFALGAVKAFLDSNPEHGVLIFESESAYTRDMLTERGIDVSRVAIIPVVTIEEFRTQALRAIRHLVSKGRAGKVLFVLDSLGNLSSAKEVADIEDGKDVRDMTKTQLIKGAFRVLTLPLGMHKFSMIVTNHTYKVFDQYKPDELSGGSGLKYAASTIVTLSSKKERDDDKSVVGAVIHCKTYKSRLTRPHTMIDCLLTFDEGLDRFYGLVDLGLRTGVVQKISTKLLFPHTFHQLTDAEDVLSQVREITKNPDAVETEDSALIWSDTSKEAKPLGFIFDGKFCETKQVFEKAVKKDPEKYFTQEVIDLIEAHVSPLFLYGKQEVI